MPLEYEGVRTPLESLFAQAEADLLQGLHPSESEEIGGACEIVFASGTQAYREVLLGCLVAKIQDRSINIRQPYADQGPNAFSGRSLDERAINPFLHDKRIPSSKGPYLSVFRRSVKFDANTRSGLRDQRAYDAFLKVITYMESTTSEAELRNLLMYLLYKFAELREAANVPLSRLQRISLEQYDTLLSGLLAVQSGGRLPVLLVVATFNTIKEFFNLDWDISWQGINVADSASLAAGDITVKHTDRILLAAEVTERPIDRSRIVTTFNTKISPAGIEDYLFFLKSPVASDDARQQARQYFAQGHEVNFLEIREWILMVLATLGSGGRKTFNRQLLALLDAPEVSPALKTHWNEQVARIAGGYSLGPSTTSVIKS